MSRARRMLWLTLFPDIPIRPRSRSTTSYPHSTWTSLAFTVSRLSWMRLAVAMFEARAANAP